MNEQHKQAISKAKTGFRHSNETRDKMKQSRLNYIVSKVETWILISPHNEIKRTNSLKSFCAERNLAYSALRKKAINNDGRAVERGPSLGWAVYGKVKS